MAQNLIFCVPAQRSKKIEFLSKLIKNIDYTQINHFNSFFLFCQNPAKAAVNSFETMQITFDCIISTKLMCSTGLLLHEEVTENISA